MRAIVSAREQYELLSPWREAMPTVYHYTSPEAAEAIHRDKKFDPQFGGPYSWFTDTQHDPHASDTAMGESEVALNVPDDYPLEHISPREHDFDSNAKWHYIPNGDIKPEWIQSL